MCFVFILLILIIVLSVLGVSLFNYGFYNPAKKHKHFETYQISEFYKNYSNTVVPLIDKLRKEPCEKVEIRSYDGLRLVGRYYHQEDGAPVAIMMHGWRGCACGDFSGGYFLYKKLGFNILLIDERACGDSEGRVITFGIKESRDAVAWANYITERFGKDIGIILCGISLGGATVMMSAARGLPENVKAIVEDCGYSAPRDEIRSVAKSMHFPAGICYPVCRLFARIMGGFDLEEISAKEAVSKTDIPIMFIHGEDDSFVPFYMCEEVYNACASYKEKFTVPGATHGVSYLENPDGYANAVEHFLRTVKVIK